MRNRLTTRIISSIITVGLLCLSLLASRWVPFGHSMKDVVKGPSEDRLLQVQGGEEIVGLQILKVYNSRNSPLKVLFPMSIFQDRAGRFWIGGEGEALLQMYDEYTNEWTTFTDEDTVAGLHYNSGAVFPYPLEQITQDADGNLWFSSRSRIAGKPIITTLNGNNWRRIELERGPWEFHSTGMFVGGNGKPRVWLEDRVLNVEEHRLLPFLKLSQAMTKGAHRALIQSEEDDVPEYEISSAVEDGSGSIWFGTRSGILRYAIQTSTFATYSQNIILNADRIYKDRDGRLWFINPRGEIQVYNTKGRSWLSYNLFQHLPNAEHSDPVGKLIIRTQGICQDKLGRMIFSQAKNTWQFSNAKNSRLPHSNIMSILEDRLGRVWIGTKKGILVAR